MRRTTDLTHSGLRFARLLAALLVAMTLFGCGTDHSISRAGSLTVHTFTRDSTRSYVLAEGRSLVMIDSGYERNAAALDEALRDEGLDPRELRAVVITHGHADHAGGARFFQQRYGARVIAGRGDANQLASGRNDPLCPTGLLGRFRRGTDQGAIYTPTRVDTWVDDATNLAPLTGINATVYSLPGHTPGSLVVVAGDAAFVGDLFRGALVGSGAATHLYMCDLDDNRADVARLLGALAPRAETFYTGHFGPVARPDVAAQFLP